MRSLLVAAVAVFMIPSVSLAQAPTGVVITGIVGGNQLAVSAGNQGGNLVGAGKLTAPNGSFYNLQVTSGTIQQGRYATLQGNILAPNGAVAAPFILNGDSVTGNIVFSYTVGGKVVKQTTKGAVVIK